MTCSLVWVTYFSGEDQDVAPLFPIWIMSPLLVPWPVLLTFIFDSGSTYQLPELVYYSATVSVFHILINKQMKSAFYWLRSSTLYRLPSEERFSSVFVIRLPLSGDSRAELGTFCMQSECSVTELWSHPTSSPGKLWSQSILLWCLGSCTSLV